ncbi:glucosamine--fructose-6-phosphate aminotransferase (isomerizing) [Saccharothrix saharensis]|uniref:Glutamine--fructose-6-phosphate aminotransferase [isomerizing] n=1 Tax=Saccharothrix saharensis TaxID=571190 RepID=A0A543J8U7_9PSEU|nr:SIS domain-containing protein [Saccharothrix saharensis]TQM79247.1 glucosamine--fructose-6-phosphate aminotransferase (isomerizing) [Saccharothrix saharensis]
MTGFAFDQHVLQQPDVVAALLDAELPALDPDRPVVFTGIGTSLHACRMAAAWTRIVTDGRVRPAAIDAHDLALSESVQPDDQVVVVSHRGTKRYPNRVLAAAREAGASTIAITGEGAHTPVADVVVRTCPQERASTHTVSYTAALVVLGRLVARAFDATGLAEALAEAPGAMRDTLALPLPTEAVDAVVSASPIIVTGTGLDAITADEVALKLKEGTYRWAEGLHTEFALHGTPAVFSSSTAAFLLRAADDGDRTADLQGLLDELDATTLVVAEDGDVRFAATHPLARPLVTVLPFQRLVSAAAVRLDANPDLTHLEAEPWASAIRAVQL